MRWTVPLLAIIFGIALSAPAGAKTTTNAPPGNSGISQYVEVVPSVSGGKPSKNVKRDGDVKATGKLARAGKDGQRLAAIAADTAPQGTAAPTATPTARKKAKKKSSAPSKPAVTTTTTPTTTTSLEDKKSRHALATAFTTGGGGGGDGGLGIPLLVPMIVSALVVGGMAFLARRRSPDVDAGADA